MRLLAIVILSLSACTVEEDPTRRYPTPNANACATLGATRCAGSWVQTCVNNIWTATTDCSATGASCVESSSNPGTFVCEVVTTCSQPGAERCNGDVIETCIGTDWVAGQDCSLTGSTCEVSGTTADCQPAGCISSQLGDTMCVGSVLLECDGSSWQVIEDCAERNPPHLCELSTVTGVASCVADACTAAQLGATKCNGNLLMECNGTTYVLQEDCALSGEICEEFFQGVARCEPDTPPAALFEACTGAGQGNCESADMACAQVILFSDATICVIDCSTNASLCDSITIDGNPVAGYCEPGVFEGTSTTFSDVPFCYPLSERNELCLENDDGCAGNLTCEALTEGWNPECKLTCSGDQVGTSPTACAGQPCLRSPFVEIEQQGGEDRTCLTPGSTTECSATYECTEVSTGDTTTGLFCARRRGVCGNEAPPAGPFASQTEVSSYVDDDTNLCELLGADQYCGADDVGGAVNECVSTGFAFRYDPAIPCSDFDDYLGCFGLGECITFDGVNFECGVGIGVCQRFCTEQDGSTAGTCDNGDTCQVPTYPIGRPAILFDGSDQPVECTTLGAATECDAVAPGEGFICDDYFSDGYFCLKTREVCGP